jgi:hypothetical protein
MKLYLEKKYYHRLQVTIYLCLVGCGRELQHIQRCSINNNGYLALLILSFEIQDQERCEQDP